MVQYKNQLRDNHLSKQNRQVHMVSQGLILWADDSDSIIRYLFLFSSLNLELWKKKSP